MRAVGGFVMAGDASDSGGAAEASAGAAAAGVGTGEAAAFYAVPDWGRGAASRKACSSRHEAALGAAGGGRGPAGTPPWLAALLLKRPLSSRVPVLPWRRLSESKLLTIAEGNFGSVLKGSLADTGEPVAVKVLKKGQVPKDRAIAAADLIAEAEVLCDANRCRKLHDHVMGRAGRLVLGTVAHSTGAAGETSRGMAQAVPLVGLVIEGPLAPAMVMDWCGGPTVEKVVFNGDIDPPALRTRMLLGVGIAHAVACLAKGGIAHRDLKPDNIVLAQPLPIEPAVLHGHEVSGLVRIADFGLSAKVTRGALNSYGDHEPTHYAQYTVSHVFILFSPPERAGEWTSDADALSEGERPEARKKYGLEGDVYALGLTLYEVLSGRRAFTRPGAESAVARARERIHKFQVRANADLLDPDVNLADAATAAGWPDNVPDSLRSCVTACLERDPGARPLAQKVFDKLILELRKMEDAIRAKAAEAEAQQKEKERAEAEQKKKELRIQQRKAEEERQVAAEARRKQEKHEQLELIRRQASKSLHFKACRFVRRTTAGHVVLCATVVAAALNLAGVFWDGTWMQMTVQSMPDTEFPLTCEVLAMDLSTNFLANTTALGITHCPELNVSFGTPRFLGASQIAAPVMAAPYLHIAAWSSVAVVLITAARLWMRGLSSHVSEAESMGAYPFATAISGFDAGFPGRASDQKDDDSSEGEVITPEEKEAQIMIASIVAWDARLFGVQLLLGSLAASLAVSATLAMAVFFANDGIMIDCVTATTTASMDPAPPAPCLLEGGGQTPVVLVILAQGVSLGALLFAVGPLIGLAGVLFMSTLSLPWLLLDSSLPQAAGFQSASSVALVVGVLSVVVGNKVGAHTPSVDDDQDVPRFALRVTVAFVTTFGVAIGGIVTGALVTIDTFQLVSSVVALVLLVGAMCVLACSREAACLQGVLACFGVVTLLEIASGIMFARAMTELTAFQSAGVGFSTTVVLLPWVVAMVLSHVAFALSGGDWALSTITKRWRAIRAPRCLEL